MPLHTMWFIVHFDNTCYVFSAELIHESCLFFPFLFFFFVFVSRCPSHVNQASNDILLLDFSAEVDSNQNCIKGNNFSSDFGYFPAPDSDPFRDDPLSKSSSSFAPDNGHAPPAAGNQLNGTASSTSKTLFTDGLNEEAEYLSQRMNGLSSKSMIFALSNGQWPLGGSIPEGNAVAMMDGNDSGQALSAKNPFFDPPLKTSPVSNGLSHPPEPPATHSKDSVVISPPPQSSKSGRGRRSAKVKLHSWVNYSEAACVCHTSGANISLSEHLEHALVSGRKR